ncbi:hypothetical protein BDB01DRAFT_259260 [Pilobolus umbonatus]|nr:hypothetical protein BDB01DRAFT_259260 [Pilobolus umbonatus]
MSKKSSRSKKSDGTNMPNFVFKLGEGAASPSFSYPGSTPASPSASSVGFAFGSNPSSPATSSFNFGSSAPGSQSFVFGDNKAPSAFQFNTTSTGLGNSPSVLKRGASDLIGTNTSEKSSLRRTNSDLSFGSSTPSTPTTSSMRPFVFGNTPQTPSTTPSATTNTSNTLNNPTISFGTTPTTTTSSTTPPVPISFGTSAPATSAFSFGTPTSSTSSTTATTTTTSTPSFSFGAAPKTTSTTTSTPAFSFGAPSKPAGKPAETAQASSAPIFQFGKPAETSQPASTSVSSSTTPPTTSTSTSTSTDKAVAPLFSLGNKDTSTAASTSTFSFGKSTSTDKDTPTFSFGKSASTEKDTPTVTSSPFTFSTNTPTSTSADKPIVNEPPKPNQFSFTKILEDMGKVTIQPPSAIQASLITHTLSGLQQKQQSTFHTSFRIDNILPSTRFAELPEQAQKELDDLEKYIRGEKQRSEYIDNHKMSHHVKQMDKAKQTTETMIQQLDALSSTLQGKMESIEILYNNVKEQSRHAGEGGAVIEACKHPGDTNRWLFGYGEQDDYFAVHAKRLTSRLEEYKKCIWEIERTIESWTQNRRQSPQDIAHIMYEQNQTFLALSNKVATLHEKVKVEKEYFGQYLKMYK